MLLTEQLLTGWFATRIDILWFYSLPMLKPTMPELLGVCGTIHGASKRRPQARSHTTNARQRCTSNCSTQISPGGSILCLASWQPICHGPLPAVHHSPAAGGESHLPHLLRPQQLPKWTTMALSHLQACVLFREQYNSHLCFLTGRGAGWLPVR